MPGKGIVLIVFLSFLLLPAIVQASCSLGASPLTMRVKATPGQTFTATWNLYNIYGDRITHIRLSVVESPPGWEVSVAPKLHNTSYNVTGLLQTTEENVALRPTKIIDSLPASIPEGMGYLKHPNQAGYIPAMIIDISVKVPEDAEPWKDYKITLGGIGNCFSEGVFPGISTQLKMNIDTISAEEYYEEELPLSEAPREVEEFWEEGEIGEGEASITGAFIDNAPWMGIIIVLVVIAGWLILTKRKTIKTEGFK